MPCFVEAELHFSTALVRISRRCLLTMRRLVLAVFCIGCLATTEVVAKESDELQFVVEKQSRHTIRRKSDNVQLTFHKKPLLKFNNPVSGVVAGGVFYWSHKGMPYAISKSFVNARQSAWGEVVCPLTQERLVLDKNRGLSGTAWTKLMDVAAPSDRTSIRTAQMRRIASEFSVIDYIAQQPGEDFSGTAWELRLLTSPLVQYQSSNGAKVDGCVVGFVQGTNVEVVLTIEARRGGKRPGWYYAFTRLTNFGLEAKRKDKVVWSAKAIRPSASNRLPSMFSNWTNLSPYPFRAANSLALD